jgi:hypothetical protein
MDVDVVELLAHRKTHNVSQGMTWHGNDMTDG